MNQPCDPELSALAAIDVQPGVCYIRQRRAALESFPFELVKVVSVKRDWAGLGKRLALGAAASVPLGFLGLRVLVNPLPGKTISGHMLRLELMLCPSCVERRRG
jgi:hypothetical protein